MFDAFWFKYLSVSNLFHSEFDFTTKMPVLVWSFRFRGKNTIFTDYFVGKELTKHLGYILQVSLTGMSALLALLHHSQFYQEVQTMLTMYYPQPAIHPVSVAGVNSPLTTPLGSQDTAITLTSGSFNDTFIGTGAPVKASDIHIKFIT